MEYVQERITTLHALCDRIPQIPVDRTAVVVPMTQREYGSLAADRVLTELSAIDPERVIVPLRSSADRVRSVHEWLQGYDVRVDVRWCDGPRITDLLSTHGLNGDRGKGRDVWLALGSALESDYVVFHDADTKTYDRSYVPKLLFPLVNGHEFSKGYYARVENDRLYGRLCRLLYAPLVRLLADEHDAPIVEYLEAFRYALAGEFAGSSDLLADVRMQRSWGLEVGTLGDAFDRAGFAGTAQVDLGAYEHDHRSVEGPTGLSDMSAAVSDALLRAVSERGVDPDFETIADRYRTVAAQFVRQYAVDASYNGLEYDRDGEREQVESYAASIAEPGPDRRLPAWTDAPIAPEDVADAAARDLEAAIDAST
ncbi:MAG: glycosyl transferase family 2 [Halobacteriota archaeon]